MRTANEGTEPAEAMSRAKIFAILQGPHSHVKSMSVKALERLISAGRIAHYRDGASLGIAGDLITDLHIVLHGTIRSEKTSAEGREHVFALLEPGNMSGLFGVIDGRPNPHDHITQGETLTLRLSARTANELIDTDKEFRDAVLALFCERLRYSFTALYEYAIAPPITRLASRLMSLALSHGKRVNAGTLLDVRLTQDSLGAMIGLSRQSTNKLLQELRANGVIERSHGKIIITDREALLSHAYAFGE
jgi:CRP/FNR family cyclic AMP-dependent transcriptional regulator